MSMVAFFVSCLFRRQPHQPHRPSCVYSITWLLFSSSGDAVSVNGNWSSSASNCLPNRSTFKVNQPNVANPIETHSDWLACQFSCVELLSKVLLVFFSFNRIKNKTDSKWVESLRKRHDGDLKLIITSDEINVTLVAIVWAGGGEIQFEWTFEWSKSLFGRNSSIPIDRAWMGRRWIPTKNHPVVAIIIIINTEIIINSRFNFEQSDDNRCRQCLRE